MAEHIRDAFRKQVFTPPASGRRMANDDVYYNCPHCGETHYVKKQPRGEFVTGCVKMAGNTRVLIEDRE